MLLAIDFEQHEVMLTCDEWQAGLARQSIDEAAAGPLFCDCNRKRKACKYRRGVELEVVRWQLPQTG